MQLDMWNVPEIDPDILPILADPECAIALSISGGKDSQAMLNWVMHLRSKYGWKGECYAMHADLGRIEWAQTADFVERLAESHKLNLAIIRREKGDMIDRWKERYATLKAQGNTKPFWSSAASRYCTNELKTQVIDKYLRRHKLVVNVMGLRAEESKSRAMKKIVSIRERICTETIASKAINKSKIEKSWASVGECWTKWNQLGRTGRFAVDWNPIHHWEGDLVWEWCGTSMEEYQRRRKLPDKLALEGWTAHPAYVLGQGNERLSCAFCIMGSKNDLTNAIPYNLESYKILVEMEEESGWTFQNGKSLKDLYSDRLDSLTLRN